MKQDGWLIVQPLVSDPGSGSTAGKYEQEIALGRHMNGMAVDDVDLWLCVEHRRHPIERVRKIEVVDVQPGHDVAAGVVPAFLDGGCLAGIRVPVPVRDGNVVRGEHLLCTIVPAGIERGDLHLDTLRLDAAQRRLEEVDMIADGNRYAERQSRFQARKRTACTRADQGARNHIMIGLP